MGTITFKIIRSVAALAFALDVGWKILLPSPLMARHLSGRTDPLAARRLQEARERAALTQGAAARACSVSVETVWNWENGRSEPRLSDLKTLCSLYGSTPNAIVLGAA